MSCSASTVRARDRGARWIPVVIPIVLVAALALGAVPATAQARVATTPTARTKYYSTALNYVTRFFPRFFTWYAERGAVPTNQLFSVITGPSGIIGPDWRLYPKPNVDTVYVAATKFNVSQGPVILTIPPTQARFSIANVDVWGDYLTLVPAEPGTYALALAGWHGRLPAGVTRINIPYPLTTLIIRADRYTKGVNTIAEAKTFSSEVRLAPLPAYRKNPSSGRPIVIPQALVAGSAKVASDSEIQDSPTRYLETLQDAMHSPLTAPLTASDRSLSAAFDKVFAAAQQAQARGNYLPMSQVVLAVHTAYNMIINHYMSHTQPGDEWIYFNDAGRFGTNYLDRDGVAEFFFGINTPATALYYDDYVDNAGNPLDTATYPFYRLTFTKAQIPDAVRFWSLTLYVGRADHLFAPDYPVVPTKNVASYMPLVRNANGSITVYIQPTPPANPALRANWLPTPAAGPFAVSLRVYGPTGNTANGESYVPPGIKALGVLIHRALR